MTQRRVAITGLGLVSPYGGDLRDFFSHLCNQESAIGYLNTEDASRPLAMPFTLCSGFDANAALGRPLALLMDRFAHLALASSFSAWEDAGLTRQGNGHERDNWGCTWGTSMGGAVAIEKAYRELLQNGRDRLPPSSVVIAMHNAANAHISIQLGLGGLSTSHAAACASATIAIGEAFRRVRSGEATVMLTGGSDTPQTLGVARAWEALRVLAPGDASTAARACRPFAADRQGLVLGEGGAALVLEDWEHAHARGARIHAEIVGYGTSCDRNHLVKPCSDGQVRALNNTLADAGLSADEIDYINAHGTATPEGDPTEITALKRVFGARAEELAVSSTKSLHGHLLGAAGALEAVVTALALREQILPPTAHLTTVDPNCVGVHHIREACTRPVRAALSNSFAFGGSNAVLAFRAAPQ